MNYTDEELLSHAGGIYLNRVKNLERVCKEKSYTLPSETDESRKECILSIFAQLKVGELQIVRRDAGYEVVKRGH